MHHVETSSQAQKSTVSVKMLDIIKDFELAFKRIHRVQREQELNPEFRRNIPEGFVA